MWKTNYVFYFQNLKNIYHAILSGILFHSFISYNFKHSSDVQLTWIYSHIFERYICSLLLHVKLYQLLYAKFLENNNFQAIHLYSVDTIFNQWHNIYADCYQMAWKQNGNMYERLRKIYYYYYYYYWKLSVFLNDCKLCGVVVMAPDLESVRCSSTGFLGFGKEKPV